MQNVTNGKTPCKTPSFSRQKMVFYSAKGRLLQSTEHQALIHATQKAAAVIDEQTRKNIENIS